MTTPGERAGAIGTRPETSAAAGPVADLTVDPGPAGRTIVGLLRGDPFEATFEAAGVGLAIVDLTGLYVRVNDAYAALHDRAVEDFVGEEIGYQQDQLAALLVGVGGAATVRGEHETRPGTWASVGVRLHRAPDGRPLWFVVSAEDVTRRRRAEQQLEHRALHDPLTGLANRVLVLDRLRTALARSARGAGDVGILFGDLDGFKAINDLHGHLLGDVVLQVVAERLRAAVRPNDTVGRLGGDEFVVVVDPPVTAEHLDALAGRLTAAVGAPLREQGTDTRVGISLGSATGRGPDVTAEALLDLADAEMYRVKHARRGPAPA